MTILPIILLSLLILAGAGYTVWSDIQEIKNGPPDNDCELAADLENNKAVTFFDMQISIQREIAANAETAYKTACQQVEHDKELNQYCMIVPQKLVLKHIRDKDKAANNLYSARNKIYNMQLKREKAISKQ